MNAVQSVMITGANAGLGFECARQMSEKSEVKKVYLACRTESKALAAKADLEAKTGRDIFEIVLLDMMDLDSVRAAVEALHQPIDAVVLNAGGMGGTTPNALTSDGVTHIFAANVLGHAVFVDELLKRQLLRSVVLYAGSEAARGIPSMGVAQPELSNSSVDEFVSIADGTKFSKNADPMLIYGAVKLTAAMWMGAMARQYPHIRFVTMSPGGTTGTNGMDDLPFFKKLMFKYIGGLLMPLFGMMHGVEVGAKRYVDGIHQSTFQSGHFYASKGGSPTGAVVDQEVLFPYLAEASSQQNAHDAIYRFIQ